MRSHLSPGAAAASLFCGCPHVYKPRNAPAQARRGIRRIPRLQRLQAFSKVPVSPLTSSSSGRNLFRSFAPPLPAADAALVFGEAPG